MFTEANAAIQGIKAALDILRANKELSRYNEVSAAISEGYSKVLAAQDLVEDLRSRNSALSDTIRQLEKKISSNEKFDREISSYSFHKLESGMIVYKIKPEHEEIGGPHYACTACASDGKISLFQPALNGTRLVCDYCKKNVNTGWKPGSHKTPK